MNDFWFVTFGDSRLEEARRRIRHQAERMGAEAIVITEKDAVKIPMEVIHAGISVPVYVICVEVNFQQGRDEFKALLAQRLAAKLGK